MQNEGGKWDPATVLGISSNSNALVIGNAAFLPWLRNETEHITQARKPSQLLQLISENSFDRIIIGREVDFSNDFITIAARGLSKTNGIVAYFSNNETEAWQFARAIEFFYPSAEVVEVETTFGRVSFAKITGASWREIFN